MSGFGHPALLTLLVLPVLMALYYYRAYKRDGRARLAFAEPDLFPLLGLGGGGPGRYIGYSLITAAVLLAAIAIARPLGRPAEASDTDVAMDVIVALDVSDSMGVGDAGGDRLTAAKDFVKRLVHQAPGNRYGLILFSGDAVITCPATLDHDAFLGFVDDADFARATLPGTAIGEAILTAATRFKSGDIPRAAVVVSDGGNTYGADPVKAAQAAKGKGMKVITVGVGTAAGGKIPAAYDFYGRLTYKRDRQGQTVVSALDEPALKAVAESGGGGYFAASEPGSVGALAKALSVKSKKSIEAPFRGAKEYGPWFALAAVVLVAAGLVI
jgi:Ca-activated chloride channel family protein